MIKARVWRVYDEVGCAACQNGDFDLAYRMFSAALETCAFDKSLRIERARSLIGLADTHCQRNDIEQAEKLYNRALNLAIRFNPNSGPGRLLLARALDRLGAVRMQQGRYDQSLKLLQRCARILENLAHGDRTALSNVLLRISYINSVKGNPAAALVALRRARAVQAAPASLDASSWR